LFVGIPKDLGFPNRDGTLKSRYFSLLTAQSKTIVVSNEGPSPTVCYQQESERITIDDSEQSQHTVTPVNKTELVIGKYRQDVSEALRLCRLLGHHDPRALLAHGLNRRAEARWPWAEAKQADHSASGSNPSIGQEDHINMVLADTATAVYDAIFAEPPRSPRMKEN
jgi:hypothetical protein